MPKTGIEQTAISSLETCFGVANGAESGALGALDERLRRLIECWPRLTGEDRQALVDHAEHLVALRNQGAVAGR